MASIFSKIRTIGLSNIHGVLDAVIDLNSVGGVEQHIRDLEDARKDLEGTLAEARYDLRNRTNNLATHTAHASSLETNIRTLAAAGGDQNMTSAKLLASELAALRKTIVSEEQDTSEASATVDKLRDAVSSVNVKEGEMKAKLGQLRSTVGMAKAKDRAASALDAVGGAIEAGGSIDSAVDRAGRQGARADAAFDRAIGSLPDRAQNSAEADAILAELTAPKPTQP